MIILGGEYAFDLYGLINEIINCLKELIIAFVPNVVKYIKEKVHFCKGIKILRDKYSKKDIGIYYVLKDRKFKKILNERLRKKSYYYLRKTVKEILVGYEDSKVDRVLDDILDTFRSIEEFEDNVTMIEENKVLMHISKTSSKETIESQCKKEIKEVFFNNCKIIIIKMK